MKRIIKCGNCKETIEIDDKVFEDDFVYTVECECCYCDVNVEAIYDENDEEKIIDVSVY